MKKLPQPRLRNNKKFRNRKIKFSDKSQISFQKKEIIVVLTYKLIWFL